MTIGDKSSWGVPDFNEVADQITSIGTRVTTLESGGSQPSSAIISTDGVTTFRRSATGAIVETNVDPSVVMQNLANNLAGAATPGLKTAAGNAIGDVEIAPGTYTPATVWTLPPVPTGTTPAKGRFRIRFRAGAVWALNANGPRFHDYGRTADHDWFGNFDIADPVIDASGLAGVDTTSNKGKNHVLTGTYVNGSSTSGQRVNFSSIVITNPVTLSVPSDSTTAQHRRNICILIYQPTASEGTQNYAKDIVVRNPQLSGGNAGIEIAAITTSATVAGVNVYLDRLLIEGGYHTVGSALGAFASSNIQVISYGFGGKITIRDFYGEYSGDVGIEVDACDDFLADNVTIRDARGAHFYHIGLRAPAHPGLACVRWSRCTAITIDQIVGAAYKCATASYAGTTTPISRVEILDCGHYINQANPGPIGSVGFIDNAAPTGSQTRQLYIRNFRSFYDGISTASSITVVPATIAPSGTTTNSIDIDGFSVRLKGAYTGSSFGFSAILLQGTNMAATVRRVRGDLAELTGITTLTGLSLVQVGGASGQVATLARPIRVERCGWDNSGDATALRMLNLQGTSQVTYNSFPVIADSCDYEGCGTLPEASAFSIGSGALLNIEGQKARTNLAYTSGATMKPSALLGRLQTLTITDATAYTIQGQGLGGAVHGAELIIWIYNNSGGALGAATWSNVTLTGGAWTNPASTKFRWIHFRFDAVRDNKYYEVARAAADI